MLEPAVQVGNAAEARSLFAALKVAGTSAQQAGALFAELGRAIARHGAGAHRQASDALRRDVDDAAAELQAAAFCLPAGPLRDEADAIAAALAREPTSGVVNDLRARVLEYTRAAARARRSVAEQGRALARGVASGAGTLAGVAEVEDFEEGGDIEEGGEFVEGADEQPADEQPEQPEQPADPADDLKTVKDQRRQLSALLRHLELCFKCLQSISECRERLRVVRSAQYLRKYETTLAGELRRLPRAVEELRAAGARFDPASSHAQIVEATLLVAEREEHQTESVLQALGVDVGQHLRRLRKAIAARERKLLAAAPPPPPADSAGEAGSAGDDAARGLVFSARPVDRQEFLVVREGDGLAVPYRGRDAARRPKVESSEYQPSSEDLAALSLAGGGLGF